MVEKPKLDGFDEFWRAFPRKREKIAAMRMYARALKMTTAAEILRAAKLYAAEVAGKEDRFIKYPSGWLNGGRWGDYPQPVKPPEYADGFTPHGFYAKFTSPEMEAWTAYGRSIGKSYPKDRSGGWYFPSRWPPGSAPSVDRRDVGDDAGAANAGH